MCELSEDTKQRMAHLNLGPYEFKKETEDKVPFVVRHLETPLSPVSSLTSFSTRGNECYRGDDDLSALDSHRPSHPQDSRRMHIDDLQMSLGHVKGSVPLRTERGAASSHKASCPHSSAILRRPPSPVLNRSSLRERFQRDHRKPSTWEEIHSRVKNILKTHGELQRSIFDNSDSWKGSYSRRNIGHRTPPSTQELQSSHSNVPHTSVHLDKGEFWSNKASAHKGKSHRVIFEESMEKIYNNMYRKASSPHTCRRSHSS